MCVDRGNFVSLNEVRQRMNTDGKARTQNEEFDLVNNGFSGILLITF